MFTPEHPLTILKQRVPNMKSYPSSLDIMDAPLASCGRCLDPLSTSPRV